MSLRVAVIGAGVAGVTTAWELLNDGHQVEVFDGSSGIAEGASFASTGCVGPASMSAWDFAGHGLSAGTSVILPPPWARSLAGMGWLRQRKRHLAADLQNTVFDAAHALGQLSVERISSSLKLLYQEVETAPGVLILLSTDEVRKSTRLGLEQLKRVQTPLFELDAGSVRSVEIALNPDRPLAGAIALPGDFVLNGRQWLALLKAEMSRLGAVFHLGTEVSQLTPQGGFVTSTDGGPPPASHQFDAVVVCTGHNALKLLKPLGVEWPLLILNHCSVTATVREPLNAPTSAVIDAQQRVIITRTGQRMRAAAGEALVPGASAQSVFRRLYQLMEDWFPGASQLHGANALVQTWQASCTHTPDGLPLVGRTPHPRIWMNASHGSRGWTVAPGAARMLADMVGQRTSSAPVASCSPQRFAPSA